MAEFFPPREWGLGAHLKHLYNLYVYFWRWGTWKVFDGNPGDRGVVAFITVAGFLNGPGFAGMRAYLRRRADAIWVIDCSPEGQRPEVNTRIFEGVQQPVCITIAVRDGSKDDESPATVWFRSVEGLRERKFELLAGIRLDDGGWKECPEDWGAPFLPLSAGSWSMLPAIDQLLAWSGSGTMAGRTWVIDPSPQVLRKRWTLLVQAPTDERKTELLAPHRTDRRIDTVLSEGLPGYPVPPGALEDEKTTSQCLEPVRIGFRSFDRQWIIPDKRLINRPNPALWSVRSAPGQLFLTASHDRTPTGGPALTATNLIPDLHHYHGRGGRTWPLWLNAAGTEPNVVPGVLDLIGRRIQRAVPAEDFFAYITALTANPSYTRRFQRDLLNPGLHVPLTADRVLFDEAVRLGRRVLWLHSYGESLASSAEGRPAGRPRPDDDMRAKVLIPIPDTAAGMPESFDYDEDAQTLQVGEGRIAPVLPKVWSYEVSGVHVLRRWLDRRMKEPDHRRSSSDLDAVVATSWDPDWTTELLDQINILTMLVGLEGAQAELLEKVMDGPLITTDDLANAGIGAERPSPTRPSRSRAGQLFEIDEP